MKILEKVHLRPRIDGGPHMQRRPVIPFIGDR
jgi:hypothetical protein